MTEATQTRPAVPVRSDLTLAYEVAMPQPTSHLFEVTLRVQGWTSPQLDLKMPVWTPGSYLVREYARHVQDFSTDGLEWRKIGKNHWQIDTDDRSDLTVKYRVFAHDLSVRTNHLDATHGYFNGAALFFYLPGFQHLPISVTIVPPHPDWQVTTPLPEVETNTFRAEDFDTLVDSPFEMGTHEIYDFEVLGKPHQLAIWGKGNCDPQQIVADTQKIIEVESDLFGGLPYDRYLFLLHLSAQGYGGLEHKNCCSLLYRRFGFRSPEKYQAFMQLVAHEFFHLWNVKRIRPKALETFDYDAENYTPSLWFSEGTTSHYDWHLPLRAGIYDAKTALKLLEKEISRYLTTPGRSVQPLSESSFDAWIKLYRRDANSDNNQISYYLKGAMVSLLLDLQIRSRHRNRRSLDDVMRLVWQRFGQDEIGFTPEELESLIESVAETDLSEFFYLALHTTEDLPLNHYLESFGLTLETESADAPYLGLTAKTEHGRDLIKFVASGSPAQQAGIDAGDELLAIDGLRVTADQLNDRLGDYQPGDTLQLTVFHQDQLLTQTVQLAAPRPKTYHLVPVDTPSEVQQQNFEGWLGASLESIAS